MKQRIKEKLKAATYAGLVSLAVGTSLTLEGLSAHRDDARKLEQERAFKQTQEEIRQVESYLQAVDNPEAFDGWYSLGWSMPVPDRYKEFVKNYEASK